MPELPEVEVVRAGLEAGITGHTIVSASVLHPRPVRRHLGGPDDFAATLIGRTFATPRRRGKFLWLPFTDGDALVAHLGMSGQFRLDAPSAPLQRHARVVVGLSSRDAPSSLPNDHSEGRGSASLAHDAIPEVRASASLEGTRHLRFVDQRMFGGLSISRGGATLPPEIAHIAPDLFDPALDLEALAARMRGKASAIKRVLLDQRVVSGIGNIYADEALWQVGVHGETPTRDLPDATLIALLDAARGVMAAALTQGGTSFDALYVNVNGESGYFSRSVDVYGREGKPCNRCGTPIKRIPFASRSSHLCPRCQRY